MPSLTGNPYEARRTAQAAHPLTTAGVPEPSSGMARSRTVCSSPCRKELKVEKARPGNEHPGGLMPFPLDVCPTLATLCDENRVMMEKGWAKTRCERIRVPKQKGLCLKCSHNGFKVSLKCHGVCRGSQCSDDRVHQEVQGHPHTTSIPSDEGIILSKFNMLNRRFRIGQALIQAPTWDPSEGSHRVVHNSRPQNEAGKH